MFCGGHKKPGVLNNQCFGFRKNGSVWEQAADMPKFLYNSEAVPMGGKIYIIGGYKEAPVTDVFVYDHAADKWSEGPALAKGRASACGGAYKGRLIITGGLIDQVGTDSHYLTNVEQLKWGANSWEALPSLTLRRAKHGCAVITDSNGRNGLIVVGGEGDEAGVATSVEFLDLDSPGATWEPFPSITTPRDAWPQVGIVENVPMVVGGELKPSNNLELLKEGTWTPGPYKLKIKRVQSDACIVPKSFFEC